jgi:hypothetical protein
MFKSLSRASFLNPTRIPWLLFCALTNPSLHRLEVCTPWLIACGFGTVANASGRVTVRNKLGAWPMSHLGWFGVGDGEVGTLLYVSDYKSMKIAAGGHYHRGMLAMTIHTVVGDEIAVNAVAGTAVAVATVAITTRIDIVGVLGSPCTNHGEGGIGRFSDGLASLLRVPSRSGDLFGQIP